MLLFRCGRSCVARAPEFSGHGYFTYYGALVTEGSAPTRAEEGAGDVVDSTATTPIGKKFLTADRFVQLSKLIFVLDNEVLREFDLSPIALLAVSNGADYEILLEGGARLLISAQSDLALTAANIRSALSSPSLDDTLSGGKRLDVIDVRFGNRVYYTVK